jgi:hypothetical protein
MTSHVVGRPDTKEAFLMSLTNTVVLYARPTDLPTPMLSVYDSPSACEQMTAALLREKIQDFADFRFLPLGLVRGIHIYYSTLVLDDLDN